MSNDEILSLDDLPDVMNVITAAEKVRMHPATIRTAIKRGELEAFVPRGRTDMKRCGAGQGYKITRKSLQVWYFGAEKP